MHDVRRVLERRPPQTTRVRRRPEPQLVHDRGPIRPVDDVLIPVEPRVAAALAPEQRHEALVLVLLVREPRDEAVDANRRPEAPEVGRDGGGRGVRCPVKPVLLVLLRDAQRCSAHIAL